jgi:acetate kinase
MRILAFNCGSSSLKFELIELDPADSQRSRAIARGDFERIGEHESDAVLVAGTESGKTVKVRAADHGEAARQAIAWLVKLCGGSGLRLDATAHRVVHGGPRLFGPAVLDDAALEELDRAVSFAPLHNPPALAAIRAARESLPDVPAVVLADTAFHRDLPDRARTYAIPREMAQRHQIRRYGFHGLGHAWMMERYAELAGVDPCRLNLVTLHLGAGCSATAIRAGKSVDTSMGMTPLEGLMMATRSGDIDPAIITMLCERENLTPAQVEEMLNRKSGLLGVSGVSRDVRDVIAAAEKGNSDAALAIEMFCYRVRKYIGAYLAIEGATEAIIFGGGIGEHSDSIRARICEGLEHLGVAIDAERNRAANASEACFSSDASRVKLYVVPLDEELYLARAAARLIASR